MKTQLLCLMVVAFAAISYGMVFHCGPYNCRQCPPVVPNCKNVKKCGCCDICEDSLREGDSCMMSIFMITLSQKKCGPGLLCDPEIHTCQPASAVMAKLTMKSSKVTCTDRVCRCTHEGKTLEQYEALKEEHVNNHSCNCAIEKEKYQRTGLIGKMIMCDNQGGYEKMQCTGSVCYCVDEAGVKIEETELSIGEISHDTCKV